MTLLLFFTIFFISLEHALANEISFSFDDAPRGSTQYFTGDQRTKTLIEALRNAGVKRAAFYVNTSKYGQNNGLQRIQSYKENGHLIGNHTHSHINIRKHSQEEYLLDFDKAHKLLSEDGMLDHFFRYPFLRRGKTLDEVNAIHSHIIKAGYVDAFITVDNKDFYMGWLFQNALQEGRKINYDNLKKYYVETLFKGITFYDELAIKVLGQKVKHVMLLHENDLAALFVGDLIALLQSKGWKIITPEESYSDPITAYFPNRVLHHDSGRIGSLALDKGYKGYINSGLENTEVLDKLFQDYKVID